MRISVTKMDILEGQRMDVKDCAVARAVKRETGAKRVIASQRDIIVYPRKKPLFGFIPNISFPEPVYYATPMEVRRWISQFDYNKSKLQPITFELNPI